MTTNQDRAAEVIGAWIDDNLPHDETNFGADEGIAQALADAGLLAPEETPEPEQPRPEDVPEGEVWLIRPHENADPVPAFRVHAPKYGRGKRWAHYRIGGSMLGFADDEDVTLVSRLVPEEQA